MVYCETIDKPGRRVNETSWTSAESMVLVGNVFHQLYRNPSLNQRTWENIFEEFKKQCLRLDVNGKGDRTRSDIQKHFEELQKKNLGTKGIMFQTIYAVWKKLTVDF
eukprot:snap_masked-scaffold_11-processed-gene-4.9-mRNA-1 protein AED:1.00 eAED:1.00 QI:0/-1/0/0/-1/1/1/0/106